MNVSCVYCYVICFVVKISVHLCVLVSLQKKENCAFYQIFWFDFWKFRNVCARYDPGGHLLLLGRPSFVLFVVILMLNVDCFITKMETECAYVSIDVLKFEF
jgi:hypothetical protein